MFVILDGGHGWETKGKQSRDGSLKENEFNDYMVAAVSSLLELYGIPYYILSLSHKDLRLSVRSSRQRAVAHQARIDGLIPLTISIHADAFPGEADGAFIAYYSEAGRQSAEIMSEFINTGGIRVKQPRFEDFHMLRETSGVALLMEMGMMTDESDLRLLKNAKWRNRQAHAIVLGIIKIWEWQKSGKG